jgi:endonuclease/exonuclease/phosphatase family metal-dependent hydrolase
LRCTDKEASEAPSRSEWDLMPLHEQPLHPKAGPSPHDRHHAGRLFRGVLAAVMAAAFLAIWVLHSSTVGRDIQGCPVGCALEKPRQEGPLRIISMNILHGFPTFEDLHQRLQLVADEILRQDADIVLLQEVPWAPCIGNGSRLLAELTDMNYLYMRANGNCWAILFEEGSAILSRYPLRNPAFAELMPRAGFFEHRIALQAVAETPWGDIPLFVTHLTNGDAACNEQQIIALQEFVEQTASGTALVAGDFNATPDMPQIQWLSQNWIDTALAMHPFDAEPTCCVKDIHATPEGRLEKRIDYIFVTQPESGTACIAGVERILDKPSHGSEGWLWASDHVGLILRLNLGINLGILCPND